MRQNQEDRRQEMLEQTTTPTKSGITKVRRFSFRILNVNPYIINSNKERISQKIILERRKKGMTNTLYERAKEIGEGIGLKIDQAEKMKKTTWKREVKTKIKVKIQQRLAVDLKEKSKARTIQKDKWQRKEHIKKVVQMT